MYVYPNDKIGYIVAAKSNNIDKGTINCYKFMRHESPQSFLIWDQDFNFKNWSFFEVLDESRYMSFNLNIKLTNDLYRMVNIMDGDIAKRFKKLTQMVIVSTAAVYSFLDMKLDIVSE